MNPIDHIVIHDSDSKYGNVFMIDSWHKDRGFKWDHVTSGTPIHVGYHYVIYNGYVFDSSQYIPEMDGLIIPARPESAVGAHCYSNDGNPNNDMNSRSIGICLIGNATFSSKQLASLYDLCARLKKKYSIPSEKILGHKELDDQKKDPRIDMQSLRYYLNQLPERSVGV